MRTIGRMGPGFAKALRRGKLVGLMGLIAIAAGCSTLMGPKVEKRPALASMDSQILILGLDYHAFDGDPADYCNAVVKAGGAGVGAELSGLAESGPGGPVKDMAAYYRNSQFKKSVALAKAAKAANLWYKSCFDNSNPSMNSRISGDELCKLWDEYIALLKPYMANMLIVIVSENDSALGPTKRAQLMNHALHSAAPLDHLVIMDDDNGSGTWRETHLGHTSHFNLSGKKRFFATTDNGRSIEDNLSSAEFIEMARQIHVQGISFHAYGKEATIPQADWNAIGALWK